MRVFPRVGCGLSTGCGCLGIGCWVLIMVIAGLVTGLIVII